MAQVLNYLVEGAGITALFASGAWFYGPKYGFIDATASRYIDEIYKELSGMSEMKRYYGAQWMGRLQINNRISLFAAWLLVYIMPIVNFFVNTAGTLGLFFYVYGLLKVDTPVALANWWYVWWIAGLLFGGSLMVNRHYGYLYTNDFYARTFALVLMFVGGCLIIAATVLTGILAYWSTNFNSLNAYIIGAFWVLIAYSFCMVCTFLWAAVVYFYVLSSDPEGPLTSGLVYPFVGKMQYGPVTEQLAMAQGYRPPVGAQVPGMHFGAPVTPRPPVAAGYMPMQPVAGWPQPQYTKPHGQ